MVADELLKMIKDFLNHNYSIEDFSYDFPDLLVENFESLEKQNQQLANLLNEDMPEICSGYETDADERRRFPDVYFSEEQIREKVLQIYQQALKLIK